MIFIASGEYAPNVFILCNIYMYLSLKRATFTPKLFYEVAKKPVIISMLWLERLAC